METPSAENIPDVFKHYDSPPENNPEYDATHDELTGLLNRRGMNQALDYLNQHMPSNFAVISLDLDGLKPTNDMHGHAAGDKLLKNVADSIKSSVRTEKIPVDNDYYEDSFRHSRETTSDIPDVVGSRPGGDEFVIMLPSINEEKANVVEQRIQDGLKAVGASASSGVAQHKPGMTPQAISSLADRRMYEKKRQKRAKSEQEAYDALPRHKKLISRLGDICTKYAGVSRPQE